MKYHKLKNEDEKIVDLYKRGQSSEKIAQLYQCDPSSILKVLKKNNCPTREFTETNRKYDVDEKYFEVIDTEEKAYFLGWLYADGCHHEERNQISLGLQESDKEMVEKLNSLIHPEKPIKTYFRKPPSQNSCKLLICSIKISNDLKKLGLIARKSLILQFPSLEIVPKDLVRHFIRGYFDGDGTIYLDKDGYCATFAILGSEGFCEKLREIFNENCKIYSPKIMKKGKIYSYQIHAKYPILDIYNYLYLGASIFLERKKNKFEKFIDLKNLSQ